jgi:WD40 repeat protein
VVHEDVVLAVAFSPDGTRVATGSNDHSARVFDAATGTEICRVDHDDTVWAVVFSPDGTRVATGSHDRSARVFHADTGREMCRVDHDDAVLDVAFSPDGARIATSSTNRGKPPVWTVDQSEFVKQATEGITSNLTPREWHRYFGEEQYRKTRVDLE